MDRLSSKVLELMFSLLYACLVVYCAERRKFWEQGKVKYEVHPSFWLAGNREGYLCAACHPQMQRGQRDGRQTFFRPIVVNKYHIQNCLYPVKTLICLSSFLQQSSKHESNHLFSLTDMFSCFFFLLQPLQKQKSFLKLVETIRHYNLLIVKTNFKMELNSCSLWPVPEMWMNQLRKLSEVKISYFITKDIYLPKDISLKNRIIRLYVRHMMVL